MNFKKFHESKNLFDKSNTDLIFSGTTLAVVNEWNGGGGISKVIRIPCEPLTIYTISGESDSTIFRISLSELETAPDPDVGSVECIDVLKASSVSTQTFTTTANTKYILVQVASATFDDYINVLMLNTGSTALPYEPYDAEVWHNIPCYIHKTSTDTITTLPAVLYPNDTTATVGLKGQMEQSGTPTPTTPMQPQECGERTGNLWSDNSVWSNNSTDTRTYFRLSIRFYLHDGTILQEDFFNIQSNGYKYFSVTPQQNAARLRIKHDGSSLDLIIGNMYSEFIANVPLTLSFILSGYNPTVINGINLSDIMLNTGSTPLPYEPFGVKIGILSNSTTTNVYLGEVQTTRKIGKIDLGTLNWSTTASGNFWADTAISNCRIIGNALVGNAICTHFTEVSPNSVANTPYSFSSCLNTQARPFVNKTGFEGMTTAEFKEAMSGVYMYYVLAESETAVVNEPIRKIGDYADEVSGITIPTIAGANTIDVDTTLKPSEVSVNYHGWHPVLAVHERENGAWD